MKRYIKPDFKVINIKTESPLAAGSIPMNSSESFTEKTLAAPGHYNDPFNDED